MKVLFISLLRPGDFILQVPLMRSQSAASEVHVLVNDQFQQLRELYPEFIFHFFPRQQLQTLINDQNSSLLFPFEILKRYLEDLNSHQFDSIYNLTHNRISGFVMGRLKASNKQGLEFAEDKFKPFKNTWHTFFNTTFSENKRSPFHYLTALSQSVELEIPQLNATEDRSGFKEIHFQILTSDSKKNWPIHQWVELCDRVKQSRPDLNIKVLASPQESELLSRYFSAEQMVVCNLKDARDKLKKSALLVTGDTSLAHLAAETQTPVCVLSLGSSDFTKTMPWLQGAWVLTSDIECSPCAHSVACPMEQHLCGLSLKVSTVLNVVTGILSNKYQFSVAEPQKLYRMEYQFKVGLRPVSASLTRSEIGKDEHISDLL